jgi:hypothetical protein
MLHSVVLRPRLNAPFQLRMLKTVRPLIVIKLETLLID